MLKLHVDVAYRRSAVLKIPVRPNMAIMASHLDFLFKFADISHYPLFPGALLARNAVFTAHDCVQQLRASKAPGDRCRILIVGTGGLALWALRIASHHFKHVPYRDQVVISVASLRDDELYLAQSHG